MVVLCACVPCILGQDEDVSTKLRNSFPAWQESDLQHSGFVNLCMGLLKIKASLWLPELSISCFRLKIKHLWAWVPPFLSSALLEGRHPFHTVLEEGISFKVILGEDRRGEKQLRK